MIKNISNLVQEYVNDAKSVEQVQQSKKQEMINQLFALRKRAMKLVANAKVTLVNRTQELKNINEAICKVQGHTYSDWKELPGVIDRSWYYTRECQICEKKEQSNDEPAEYKAQILKRKKQG